jgi:hypothetical protein
VAETVVRDGGGVVGRWIDGGADGRGVVRTRRWVVGWRGSGGAVSTMGRRRVG